MASNDSDPELTELQIADICICPFHDIFTPTPYCLLACTKCNNEESKRGFTHYLGYSCYNYCKCYKTCVDECVRCETNKDLCISAIDEQLWLVITRSQHLRVRVSITIQSRESTNRKCTAYLRVQAVLVWKTRCMHATHIVYAYLKQT